MNQSRLRWRKVFEKLNKQILAYELSERRIRDDVASWVEACNASNSENL